MPSALVLGFDFKQLHVIRNGFFITFQIDTAQPSQTIIIGQKRIAVYSSPAILLSPGIIL